MVETLRDLPPGTIGFLVSGTITRDEYHQMRHAIGGFGWLYPGEVRVSDPLETSLKTKACDGRLSLRKARETIRAFKFENG